MLQVLMAKTKVTVKELQILCGFLNFLGWAIFPGRAFTRRMYAKYSKCVTFGGNQKKREKMLKPHHHVRLDKEFKNDCEVWLQFLTDQQTQAIVNKPMVDLSESLTAEQLVFYSDASANKKFGFGCIFNKQWIFGRWEPGYIDHYSPSIEYLELFAFCAGLFTWQREP